MPRPQNSLRAWDKERKAMFQVCEATFNAQYDSGFSLIEAYPYDGWNKSHDAEGNWANREPRNVLEWRYLHRDIEEKLVLMWATGYEDSKQREIYDGDILELQGLWETKLAQVVWGRYGSPGYTWGQSETWLIRIIRGYAPGTEGPLLPYVEGRTGQEVRIVGNACEHPELLAVQRYNPPGAKEEHEHNNL